MSKRIGDSSASTVTFGSSPPKRSSPAASVTVGAFSSPLAARPSTSSADSASSPKPPKRQNVRTSPSSSSFPGNGGGGGVSTAKGPIDFSNLPKRTVEDYAWVDPAAITQIENVVNAMLQTDSQKDVVRELARRVAPKAEAEDIHLYFRGTPLFETATLPSGATYKTMFPKTTPKKGVPKYKSGYALPKLIVAANVQSLAEFLALLQKTNPDPINTARKTYTIASQWLADSEVYRRHHGPAAGIVVDLSQDGREVTSNLLPPGKNLAALKNYEKMIAQQACEDYLRRIYQIVVGTDIPDPSAKIGAITDLLNYAPSNLGFQYGVDGDNRHLRGTSVATHYDASEAEKRAMAAARSKGKRGGSGSGGSGSGGSGKGKGGGGPSGGSGSNASTVPMSGSFGGRARSAYYSHYADYPY